MRPETNRLASVALSILRIVAGFLLFQHGAQKLLGWFGGHAFRPFTLLWCAGCLETVGGPLILLGVLTRPVALVLAAEMFTAYRIGHAPTGHWPVQNGGMQALQFGLIFLHLAAAGPGLIALSSLSSARSSPGGWLTKLETVTRAILRIGAGFLLWQYGASKLLGLFGGHRPRLFQLRWFAGLMEFFGTPLMVAGLFTRLLAFIFSGEMAVAYWTQHFPRGPLPIRNGGEPAVLFCFIYLYLAAAGAGAISLDRLFSRKSGARSRGPKSAVRG